MCVCVCTSGWCLLWGWVSSFFVLSLVRGRKSKEEHGESFFSLCEMIALWEKGPCYDV